MLMYLYEIKYAKYIQKYQYHTNRKAEEVIKMTLTHEGGMEPRKATILKGTAKSYVLDFCFSNAAFRSLSSKSSMVPNFFISSLSAFRKKLND